MLPLQYKSFAAQTTVLLGLAVFAFFYSHYLFDYPGYSGDSIKFQYLGKVLGVCHPTGYPVYSGISHLFSMLPFKTLAFRANMVSLFFALASLGLFYGLVFRLTRQVVLSASLTFFLGITPSFWLHACVAEVYSLHWFFLVLLAWAIVGWNENPSDGRLVLMGCCLTAAMLHHLLTITLLPPVAYLLWKHIHTISWKPRLWAGLLGCLVIYVAVHSLFFIHTQSAPDYMDKEIPGLTGYINFITGGDFRGLVYENKTGTASIQGILSFMADIQKEWRVFFLLFLAGGGLIALQKRNPCSLFLLGSLLLWALLCSHYDISDISQYYSHGTIVASLFLASVLTVDKNKELSKRKKIASLCLSLSCLGTGLYLSGKVPQELIDYQRFEPFVLEEILQQAPNDALLSTKNYRYEQLLNYYATVHNDDDQDALLFMLEPHDIAAYLQGTQNLHSRGKVITGGRPVFAFSFFDRFDPNVFSLRPLPIPPNSYLAETLHERIHKWPENKLVAIVANNHAGTAITEEVFHLLQRFGIDEEWNPSRKVQFAGVFRMNGDGSAAGKYVLFEMLSIAGVARGDYLGDKQVPVKILASSLYRDTGEESYVDVANKRYVPNRYGLSFVVINEHNGAVENAFTVDTTQSIRVSPYRLKQVTLQNNEP
jgi:hypothetical protein